MVIDIPLMPPRLDMGTIANVVPFTMRENFSQMGLVEGMRKWISDELVPFVNGNINNLSKEWVDSVNALISQFETIVVQLVSDVNAEVGKVDNFVESAQAAKIAAEAARDLAESFASQAAEVQDSAITLLLNDINSQFRLTVNALLSAPVIEDVSDPGTFIIRT